MMSLLNDVLDISKISARKFELHIEPYLYSDFEKDIKAIILPRAQENQIQLEFKCQEFSTGCALFDKMRLQQIFINLLSNAVKYNKQGGKVEMTTEYKTKKTGQGYFEFHVRDNGIGMSEEFIKKSLFHEFEQENVRSGDGGGTGLGLAIVKRLVIKMDGTISCKSVEGQGTDFMLCIPSKVVEAPEKHSSIAVSYDMSSFAGKRILLCEDRPLNVKIAKLMLQRVGIIVDAAENGKIGVDLFSNSQPGYYDAILMDIRMPVMNGINATMAIRSLHRPDAKSIPIIAISANAFLEDMEQAKASGMNGYIVKPIEPKNLYGTLAEQLIKK
jgi:CheY-like chemotaxis protein